MKKVVVLSILFLFGVSHLASAQDIIYKTDGSKIEAKIMVIGDREIQYKKFSNQDGPVYSLDKAEITLITYENGEYETITSQKIKEGPAKIDLRKDYAKNMITYHLFDVVYGDFTLSYERILSSGTVGITIPLGIGYAYNSDYQSSNNEWVKNMIYSGIGINFYPTGQGKWRYFLGPNVRIGYGKQSYEYWDEQGFYYDKASEGIYTKFFVDNGIIFTPVKNLSISNVVGVGIRYFPQADYDYNVVLPTAYFAINLHYRF